MRHLIILLFAITLPLSSEAMFKRKQHASSHERGAAARHDHQNSLKGAELFQQAVYHEAPPAGSVHRSPFRPIEHRGRGYGIASLAAAFGAIGLGIVALCITLPAFMIFVGVALVVTAVVCGAIGMHYQDKGMALTGFWTGIGIIGTAMLLTIVAAILLAQEGWL